MKKKYLHQSEKLGAARRALMLPWSDIPKCFRECASAFHKLDTLSLQQPGSVWVAVVIGLMDTAGLDDEKDIEKWFEVRANAMTHDEKITLSEAVDRLADWFAEQPDDVGSWLG